MKKRANVIAMALANAELMVMGPDEHRMVKSNVKNIIKNCFKDGSGDYANRDRFLCWSLPPTGSGLQEDNIDINLPRIKNHWPKWRVRKMAFSMRSKSGYFLDLDSVLDWDNVGYFLKRGERGFKEEKEIDEYDWSTTIEPALEVYKKGDPRLSDFLNQNFITTIPIQMLFFKLGEIGSFPDPTFRMKWLSLSAYNIATIYSPMMIQKAKG